MGHDKKTHVLYTARDIAGPAKIVSINSEEFVVSDKFIAKLGIVLAIPNKYLCFDPHFINISFDLYRIRFSFIRLLISGEEIFYCTSVKERLSPLFITIPVIQHPSEAFLANTFHNAAISHPSWI